MKTATPTLARAINDRLALDLLLENGPLTAPQLRDLTGLSRPTVSDLIERLGTAGLIEVVGETGLDRRGPNARVYGIVTDRAHVAGVDLRRDAVHVTIADLTGEVVGIASRPLPRTPDLSAHVISTIDEAARVQDPHTIVIGSPGLVHPQTGLTTDSGVPGWRPDLRAELEEQLGVRVVLENEVNLAGIAEQRVGAAVGRDDFALLWLDDGIGAAVFLDGKLRRGASGGAGEVGLLRFDGRTFCDMVEAHHTKGLGLDVIADRIVEGVFALVAVLDPGLVVLGGTTGRTGGEELAALVAERLAAVSPAATEVRASVVDGNTILQGAVLTALDLARDEVFA